MRRCHSSTGSTGAGAIRLVAAERVDQRIDDIALDDQARLRRRLLDRFAELVGPHRGYDERPIEVDLLQLRVGRKIALAILPERGDDAMAASRRFRERDQRGDERRRVVPGRGGPQREHFLELVDDDEARAGHLLVEHRAKALRVSAQLVVQALLVEGREGRAHLVGEVAKRRRARNDRGQDCPRVGASFRVFFQCRNEPGEHQRRLAAARRARDEHERSRADGLGEVRDAVVAAMEQHLLALAERLEADVGPVLVGKLWRGVLVEGGERRVRPVPDAHAEKARRPAVEDLLRRAPFGEAVQHRPGPRALFDEQGDPLEVRLHERALRVGVGDDGLRRTRMIEFLQELAVLELELLEIRIAIDRPHSVGRHCMLSRGSEHSLAHTPLRSLSILKKDIPTSVHRLS